MELYYQTWFERTDFGPKKLPLWLTFFFVTQIWFISVFNQYSYEKNRLRTLLTGKSSHFVVTIKNLVVSYLVVTSTYYSSPYFIELDKTPHKYHY